MVVIWTDQVTVMWLSCDLSLPGTAHGVERTVEGVPVADPFYLPPEFREGA